MLASRERDRLYKGERIVERGGDAFRESLLEAIGPEPRRPGPHFFGRLGELRKTFDEPFWRERLRDFLRGLGVALEEFAVDRLRLRGLEPGAENIPAAAPAFYAHRDTWYANPQSQINLWMPLHDVSAKDSFAFFPALFAAPVANDSADFDYDEFKAQAGFQNPNRAAAAVFPRPLEAIGEGEPVVMPAGSLLLFSAAHLHQTSVNRTSEVRLSIDVRLVHRGDQADGKGAPNVDNRSRGSALIDYDV